MQEKGSPLRGHKTSSSFQWRGLGSWAVEDQEDLRFSGIISVTKGESAGDETGRSDCKGRAEEGGQWGHQSGSPEGQSIGYPPSVSICMSVSVYISISVSIPVCVSRRVYIYLYLYLHIYLCISIYICVSIAIYLSLYIYNYTSISLYISVSVIYISQYFYL